MTRDPDTDDFSVRERRALDAWRAPEPPADLAARVMGRLAAERGGQGSARPMALAALALALVVGLFGVRLLSSAADPRSEVGDVRVGDGGSSIEANPFSDVRS